MGMQRSGDAGESVEDPNEPLRRAVWTQPARGFSGDAIKVEKIAIAHDRRRRRARPKRFDELREVVGRARVAVSVQVNVTHHEQRTVTWG
jgi:hypothetical protein